MLYFKIFPDRIFYLNEYVVFIPVSILINYLVIRKISSHKKRVEQLKQLEKQVAEYKRQQRIHKIVYLASTGVGIGSYISMFRGGENFINVDYIDCGIESGLQYLDNDRLRKIIHHLFKNKRKGKVIYITATALCHLANQYGQHFLALPFAIGDFGVTNVYQTIKKLTVTILLGSLGPLFVVGSPAALSAAAILATLGLKLAFTNIDKILTTPAYQVSSKTLKPRIANSPEVVTLNFRNKITMNNLGNQKVECWLPDQALFNSGCKSTDIPNVINAASHGLRYDEVVNMKDVTKLDRIDFSDLLDLGNVQSSVPKSSSKIVNFLEKFGDPKDICESETWETTAPTVVEKGYLRGRTRN